MNARKTRFLLGLIILVAALAAPGPAPAEMYVEGYIGGVQAAGAGMDFVLPGSTPPSPKFVTSSLPGRFEPAVLGGLKIGTWFVKEGFLGFNYPDWMKHLGFYLDFSFHRLNLSSRSSGTSFNNFGVVTNNFSESEGTAATLAFMFAGRYGFLPDSEVPYGRLQPYVAVGPAILFATQEPHIIFDPLGQAGGPFGLKPGSDSTATICLAVEAGLRWMALKNVSIDASFKYRHAAPQFNYHFQADFTPATSVTLNPTYNLFSGQLGVGYHF